MLEIAAGLFKAAKKKEREHHLLLLLHRSSQILFVSPELNYMHKAPVEEFLEGMLGSEKKKNAFKMADVSVSQKHNIYTEGSEQIISGGSNNSETAAIPKPSG